MLPEMETPSRASTDGSGKDPSVPLSRSSSPPLGMAAHRAARLGEARGGRDPPPHEGLFAGRGEEGTRLGRVPPRLPVPVMPVRGDGDVWGSRGEGRGAPALPDPKDKHARRWEGDGTTLEDMIEWFNSRAPATLQGRHRMKAFAKYATPAARSLLEEIPEVLDDIDSWEDFLRCLRSNFPDRTQLRNLTTQEFEERSQRVLSECWKRKEDVFTAGVAFGWLVRQYTRESADSIRANEVYYKWCHQCVADAIIQWYKPRWMAEKGWDGESLPPWKWLMQGHVDWYDPRNKMAHAMLRRIRPELPTPAQLAMDAADVKLKSQKYYEKQSGGWKASSESEKRGKEADGEQVEKLVRQMQDLSIQHKASGLERKKEVAERYRMAVQSLKALPGGEAAVTYWPTSLHDPIGEGKAFSEACAAALGVAEVHGLGSADYASKHALVSHYAPSGKNVKDYLPAPTYMASERMQTGGNNLPAKGALSYSAESIPQRSYSAGGGRPPPDDSQFFWFFCQQKGHRKLRCPVRAEFLKKGIVVQRPYEGRDGKQMLGDRWDLPGHPLHGQRVKEENGKCPRVIYEDVTTRAWRSPTRWVEGRGRSLPC